MQDQWTILELRTIQDRLGTADDAGLSCRLTMQVISLVFE